MKYVKAINVDDLTGDAKRVIEEASKIFPGSTPDPIMLHACDPALLVGHWHMSQAVYFSGAYRREYKDIIAAGVSRANACSYCLEAHGDLVAQNFRDTGRAIRLGDGGLIADAEQRVLFEWSCKTLSPGAMRLEMPALAANRSEIIAIALMFHYVNRVVNVLLDDSPLALPKIPGLKQLVMLFARPMLRKLARETAARPPALNSAADDQFSWAADDPVIHSSFCNFDRAVAVAGARVLNDCGREVVEQTIQRWHGEPMRLDRNWVDDAVADAQRNDQAAARLSLLTALDSRRVTESDVLAYRRQGATETELIRLLIWSSFQATKRIGSWL